MQIMKNVSEDLFSYRGEPDPCRAVVERMSHSERQKLEAVLRSIIDANDRDKASKVYFLVGPRGGLGRNLRFHKTRGCAESSHSVKVVIKNTKAFALERGMTPCLFCYPKPKPTQPEWPWRHTIMFVFKSAGQAWRLAFFVWGPTYD
jgi:hypothetical protein